MGKQFLDSSVSIEYVYIKIEMKNKIINFTTVLMKNKIESGKKGTLHNTLLSETTNY